MGSGQRGELTDCQRYWLENLHACEVSGQKMSAYGPRSHIAPTGGIVRIPRSFGH
jgi:hypothetical protein